MIYDINTKPTYPGKENQPSSRGSFPSTIGSEESSRLSLKKT